MDWSKYVSEGEGKRKATCAFFASPDKIDCIAAIIGGAFSNNPAHHP